MAAPRRYPVAKIGDRFGSFTVTTLLPRPHRGRSDERVRVECRCGVTAEAYVFNLRNHGVCNHPKVERKPALRRALPPTRAPRRAARKSKRAHRGARK